MTCIATDGRSMACDGMTVDDDLVIGLDTPKVTRLKDGRLAGGCGDAAAIAEMTDWLNGNGKPFPDLDETAAALLVLNLDGTVDQYDWDGYGQACRIDAPAAIGSGRAVALGAMDAGAAPQRAVEIAAKRVMTVGGTIRSFSLILPTSADVQHSEINKDQSRSAGETRPGLEQVGSMGIVP